jgi:hypothetical protein
VDRLVGGRVAVAAFALAFDGEQLEAAMSSFQRKLRRVSGSVAAASVRAGKRVEA